MLWLPHRVITELRCKFNITTAILRTMALPRKFLMGVACLIFMLNGCGDAGCDRNIVIQCEKDNAASPCKGVTECYKEKECCDLEFDDRDDATIATSGSWEKPIKKNVKEHAKFICVNATPSENTPSENACK